MSIITAQKRFIPFAEYLAIDALNSGFLRDMERSPAHAQFYKQHNEATPAMALGSALHCAVLEPAEYQKRYQVMPDVASDGAPLNKRKPAHREFLANLRTDNPDVTWLSFEQDTSVREMAQALNRHPMAKELLYGEGENEVTVTFALNGVPCKVRIDRRTRTKNYSAIVDLKTGSDVSAYGFQKAIFEYGYHIQAALYDAAMTALEEPVDKFLFVAIESAPPHGVHVFELDEIILDYARQKMGKLIALYKKCKAENFWPAYSSDITVVRAPGYIEAEMSA